MEQAQPLENPSKKALLQALQAEILRTQGFRPAVPGEERVRLGPVNQAFPQKAFPLATIHEVVSDKAGDAAAASGFVSCLTHDLMGSKGAALWILKEKSIFPPAFQQFGLSPEQIIFIRLSKDKELLWTLEEGLKCPGLSAVIAEIPQLDFTASRRLQLATEQSRVTGFIFRNGVKLNTTASTARWKISALPSHSVEDLPGLGFPRWQVELQKIRNGKPGSWIMEWKDQHLQVERPVTIDIPQRHIKIA